MTIPFKLLSIPIAVAAMVAVVIGLRMRHLKKLRIKLGPRMALAFKSHPPDVQSTIEKALDASAQWGWLKDLHHRVLIKPAMYPASANLGMSTSADFIRALVRAFRKFKENLEIMLWVPDAHGIAGFDWLSILEWGHVVEQERLKLLKETSEPAFWHYDPSLQWPLPLTAAALEDSFIISLGKLSLDPVERIAGMLYHHSLFFQGGLNDHWNKHRHEVMVLGAHLYPPHVCILDGTSIPSWTGAVPDGQLSEGGFLICTPDPFAADIAAARCLKIGQVQVPALLAARKMMGSLPQVSVQGDFDGTVLAPPPGRPYHEARSIAVLRKRGLQMDSYEKWSRRVSGSREPLSYLLPRFYRCLDSLCARWWGLQR